MAPAWVLDAGVVPKPPNAGFCAVPNPPKPPVVVVVAPKIDGADDAGAPNGAETT